MVDNLQLEYLDTPIDGPCKLCRDIGLERTAKTRYLFGTDKTPIPVCATCFISIILYNIIPPDNTTFRQFIFNHFMIEVIQDYESLGLITINKKSEDI